MRQKWGNYGKSRNECGFEKWVMFLFKVFFMVWLWFGSRVWKPSFMHGRARVLWRVGVYHGITIGDRVTTQSLLDMSISTMSSNRSISLNNWFHLCFGYSSTKLAFLSSWLPKRAFYFHSLREKYDIQQIYFKSIWTCQRLRNTPFLSTIGFIFAFEIYACNLSFLLSSQKGSLLSLFERKLHNPTNILYTF